MKHQYPHIHRYEYIYKQRQNKAMYIRFALGSVPIPFETMSQCSKYCYLRALMDTRNVNDVLRGYLNNSNKKVHSLLWLAWGHKSKMIQHVGFGDYTWPKEKDDSL